MGGGRLLRTRGFMVNRQGWWGCRVNHVSITG